MEAGPKYISLKTLSKFHCEIPVPTLRDHMKRDGLPYYKIRGKILIDRDEFREWIQQYHHTGGKELQQIATEALAKLKG